MTIKKGVLAFVLCFAIGLLQANMAFGIDWEQWRIQDNSLGSFPVGVKQPAPDPRKIEAFKLNEKGNQAYKAGNWKEAIDYYKKALINSPNDGVIRQNLTNAQNALAEEKKRLATWQQLEKKNKKKREMENNQLQMLLCASNFPKDAVDAAEKGNYEDARGLSAQALLGQVRDTKYGFLDVVDLPEPVGFDEVWREKEKQLIALRKSNPYIPDKYKSLKPSFVPRLSDKKVNELEKETESAANSSARLHDYFKKLKLEEYYVEYRKCRDEISAKYGESFGKELDKGFWNGVKKLGSGSITISRALEFREIFSNIVGDCLTNATTKMDEAMKELKGKN
ncbi:MAG: tetratricopeptide repeat protein [bacterium]|nr:tetratricopeptide repeat protein [bacterium]